MGVSNPSVTWPNHTTMMTGLHPRTHGVLYNGVIERGKVGEPTKTNAAKTQQELVRVPLLFDLLKEAGKSSAAINWPCTRGSKSAADNFPDVPDQLRYTTTPVMEHLAGKGLVDGRAALYICRQFACQSPVIRADDVARALAIPGP